MLVERQAGDTWGKGVVQQLATDLQQAFPAGGFSASNLWRMRAFSRRIGPGKTRTTGARSGLEPQPGDLGALQRRAAARVLPAHDAQAGLVQERADPPDRQPELRKVACSGQTNFDQALTPELRAQAKLAVKDEYTFDFLELGEEHSERELERALIGRIEDFLRAMGSMFAFMGSQYRLEVDGREFFIDLLLFHRRLRCLVAIELKVGEFQPEFVGKMQFYLAALDRQVRQADENPRSASSCARKRAAPSWNTPCTMPISPSAWPPTRSPARCRKTWPATAPPEAIAALLEGIENEQCQDPASAGQSV